MALKTHEEKTRAVEPRLRTLDLADWLRAEFEMKGTEQLKRHNLKARRSDLET
jgi:hypothetical protein